MDEQLRQELDTAWQKGWQPRDLTWVVSNDLGLRQVDALAAAILDEARHYEGPQIDYRWQDQLERLAADHRSGIATDRHTGTLCMFLRALPTLPKLIPPPGEPAVSLAGSTDPRRTMDQRILVRVRALLAKAESTTFSSEAEALSAKAHELMARHAIDQVLLAAGSAHGEPEAQRVHIENPYLSPKVTLLSRVAVASRCRVVWNKHFRMATVFGFGPDLEATEVLFTSLLLQATSAMLAAQPDEAWRIKSFRNSFLVSYAYRIGERLDAVKSAAVADADDGSLLPVLTSRADAVDAALDTAFPSLTALKVSVSNTGGLLAGRAAADRADLHRQRVCGPTGLLDRT